MSSCDFVVWLITGKCDLRCRHCYASHFNNLNELSTEDAIKVIKELAKMNVNHISFTGGEPTLRKDLPILISQAYDLGFELSIVTSALSMNSKLISLLIRNDVEIQVSIDGATKETFTKIRGSYFELLLEKLKQLKKLGAKIRPVMTINALNYHEATEYIKLCSEMNAIGAAMIPLIPIGRADKSLMPTPKMVEMAVSSADRMADSLGLNLEVWCAPFLSAIIKRTNIYSCMIKNALDIAPDGSIMICDSLNVKIANIKDGIENAWSKKLNHELVRVLSTPRLINDICRDCRYIDVCASGCRARANAIYNDPRMPDPLCPLIKPIKHTMTKRLQ
ncbi:MAG: radical SAM protein [Candidatus Methanomethyliaceae archaeon]|nr:radical SAM protein [Candidatus Methanomethyliaceae archaeon]MDW7971094.1 radical SAM protein [Nitrososphaerota archaeon]